MTDPLGHTTTFTYSSTLQVATVTDPLDHITNYGYDTDGNLTRVADRNGTTDTFSYDALNRLTKASYGTNSARPITITAVYDKNNRPTRVAQAGSGADTFSYDGLGDILTAGTPQGTLNYTYDAAGKRLSTTAPGQGTVDYGYNHDGLLTTITRGTNKVSIGYDADLRVATVGLPGGITRTSTYDAASRLTGIGYAAGAGSLGSLGYTYTPNSQVSTVSGTLAAITLPASITSAAFNADNELTSENGTAYRYDNQGNLTSDGIRTYTWNSLGQLAAIAGRTTSTYTYDPFGRRITATTAGTMTSYLYDGSALVQQTAGTEVTNYLVGGLDNAYQESTSSSSSTLLTDRLGTVIALANPAGRITTNYTYTPGGVRTATGASSGNALGYIGAPTDPTGFDQLGARYYNPDLGRFISQDPTGFTSGTTDLYQYGLDTPTNLTDPTGLGTDGQSPPHCEGDGGGSSSSGSSDGCGGNQCPSPPAPAISGPACQLTPIPPSPPDPNVCAKNQSSVMQWICMNSGDNTWSNCVRSCLYDDIGMNGNSDLQQEWAHMKCWSVCSYSTLSSTPAK